MKGSRAMTQPEKTADVEGVGLPDLFFFKQWGGRIDKGGCLIDGGVIRC
jgi:protein gp37